MREGGDGEDRAVGCGCMILAACGLGFFGWLPLLWYGPIVGEWMWAHPRTVSAALAVLVLVLALRRPVTRRNTRHPPGGPE